MANQADPTNGPQISETSICNQALSWLAQKPISGLDERSTTAEWMRNNYAFLRDAVLEERMWTFATLRTQSTTEDVDGWGTQYSHGIDPRYISVFRVYRRVNCGTFEIDTTWRLEGDRILSNYSTVYMWGVLRLTDTGKFTPMFTQALAARIAADAAIPMTESQKLQADMWSLYGVKLGQAAARDGQQGSNEKVQSNRFVDARGRGGIPL